MRNRRLGRKLGKDSKHRKAMFRNMATELFGHGNIRTTDIKAKELRRYAEKLITLAKKDTLHARRQAAAVIRDKTVLKKLFDEIAPHFKERPGGYIRIVKLGIRKGDNAPISHIELVPEEYKLKKAKKKTSKKKSTAAATSKPAKKASSKKKAAEDLGLAEGTEAAPEVTETSEVAEVPEITEAPEIKEPKADLAESEASASKPAKAKKKTPKKPEPQAEAPKAKAQAESEGSPDSPKGEEAESGDKSSDESSTESSTEDKE